MSVLSLIAVQLAAVLSLIVCAFVEGLHYQTRLLSLTLEWHVLLSLHPGVLAAKVRDFGSNLLCAKVRPGRTADMRAWRAPNLLTKVGATRAPSTVIS